MPKRGRPLGWIFGAVAGGFLGDLESLVLPGLTGLWQVSGRAELDFDDLVRLDA